jgi:hypothetical protein
MTGIEQIANADLVIEWLVGRLIGLITTVEATEDRLGSYIKLQYQLFRLEMGVLDNNY